MNKTLSFIDKAKIVHGDRYDYSLVNYTHSKSNVKIICPVHGVFEQTPNNHLRSGGCLKCGLESTVKLKTSSRESFVNKSKLVHGDTYDYSLTEYVRAHSLVKICCPIHGVFEQTPNSHMKGRGCPSCVSSKISTKIMMSNDEFVRRSRLLHGNKYDYSLVVYRGYEQIVNIICPTHGVFTQKPREHLDACGCNMCNKNGFNKNNKGFLYVLDGGDCFKVGITNYIPSRMHTLKYNTSFDFKCVKVIEGSGHSISRLERKLHTLFVRADVGKFDGYTEWFVKFDGYLEVIERESY